MITVATSALDSTMPYFDIYVESLKTRTKLVSEVLIAKVDSPLDFNKEWSENGIKFKMFGNMKEGRLGQGLEHALGLHECIDRATNDTVLLHDPDIFFYMPVDVFLYDLKEKYNLNIIGVSHPSAAGKMPYEFFPSIQLAMVSKKDLPDENFLKGRIITDCGNFIPYPGKYLIRIGCKNEGELDDLRKVFPNPKGEYDTGSYLWVWAYEQKWKWLSFQTADIHNYTTSYYRGNVKINEKFKKEKLLYHVTSGTMQESQPDILKAFKTAWEDSLE